MRSFPRLLVTLVLCLGCQATDPGSDGARRLVLGMSLEPPHLDPTASPAAAIDEIVYANVFEGLTRVDQNGEIQPALAAEWTLSGDGLSYTFILRSGVRFHDGTRFDSATVRSSLERIRADDSVNPEKRRFEPIAKTGQPVPSNRQHLIGRVQSEHPVTLF